jgi:hypothetical protein
MTGPGHGLGMQLGLVVSVYSVSRPGGTSGATLGYTRGSL